MVGGTQLARLASWVRLSQLVAVPPTPEERLRRSDPSDGTWCCLQLMRTSQILLLSPLRPGPHGGHSSGVRSFLWGGASLLTGGEDGRLCLWGEPSPGLAAPPLPRAQQPPPHKMNAPRAQAPGDARRRAPY